MISYMFSNGLEINYDSNRIYKQNIKATASNNILCFGTIASTYLELTLDNTDGYFDTYSFKNGYINVYNDDTKKLKIYIDSVKEKNKLITIKGYDGIIKLDKTWTPCKTPITLYSFMEDILKQCRLTMNGFLLTNSGFKIQNIDDLKGKTCRECLSYALELVGVYGSLNANEEFVFKWFNTSNTKEIDINRLINYNTDYENTIVDNIYFIRGSKVYKTNEDEINGSIFISKDNPLLKNASSSKVQFILNNLSSKANLEYLPCTISCADFFTYDIGDVVSFVDYKGNVRNGLVGTINYSEYNSCNITSPTTDTQDITTTETENNETNNTTTSKSNSNVTFYKKVDSTNIEYKECSDTTEIFYNVNFNINELVDTIQIVINNIPYKSYNVQVGYNTINLMVLGDMITENIMTIEIVTSNTLDNIEVNSIYRNCLIIDYDEEDEEIGCGEILIESIPSGYSINYKNTLKFYKGLQGWIYRTADVTSYGDNRENGNLESLYRISSQNYTITDTYYLPEIYTTKLRDLYNDLMKNKQYIKISLNGSFSDYYGNETIYDNSPLNLENGFCYMKKMKGETSFKYYYTTTGIIEIDDETIIQIAYYHLTGKEPNWNNLNNLTLDIQLLDEDLKMLNGWSNYIKDLTLKDENGEEILDINGDKIKYVSNNESVKCGYWGCIGDFYESCYLELCENNIKKELPFITSGTTTNSFYIFREYSKEGFENFKAN